MKRLALSLLAVAAFSGSALAADLAPRYTKAPVAAPVAYTSWTGCYLGGGGGYGMWNQENTNFAGAPGATRVLLNDFTTSGGRGGFGTLQVGCDYQFSNFVVGAFGDYDFASIKGRVSDGIPVFGGVGDEKLSSQWAVGGRIGYLVLPNLLTYFSGGYTEARFDGFREICANSICGTIGSPNGLSIGDRTYKGWFLGAGDEYALGFLPGLFWKTEYRLSRFDGRTDRFADATLCGTCVSPFTVDSKKWEQTIRSELVYRFNWGGPAIAARY
jgi:outer membrane immunogenic protein